MNTYVMTITYDESKDTGRAITERLMNVMCELSGVDGVREVKLAQPGPPRRIDFMPGVEQQREQS